jgi:hypothetical protein
MGISNCCFGGELFTDFLVRKLGTSGIYVMGRYSDSAGQNNIYKFNNIRGAHGTKYSIRKSQGTKIVKLQWFNKRKCVLFFYADMLLGV